MIMRRLFVGLLALLTMTACLVVATSRRDYAAQDREVVSSAASAQHPAGTDGLGRDRMVRVALALLISQAGSALAALVTTAAAAAVGSLSAFGPRWLGQLAMMICDFFLALPWLFLLMMIRAALPLTTSPGRSALLTFVVLAALGWPACARAVYRGVLDLRRSEWMLQVRAGGLGGRHALRHVLPNLGSLLLPQFLVSLPAFVIAEANLGALGLGIGEPLPSWGGMLLELDNSAMLMQTRWVFLPICLLVLVLMLLEAIAAEV